MPIIPEIDMKKSFTIDQLENDKEYWIHLPNRIQKGLVKFDVEQDWWNFNYFDILTESFLNMSKYDLNGILFFQCLEDLIDYYYPGYGN